MVDRVRRSKNPNDRFSFLLSELNDQSGALVSTLTKVAALEDKALISSCRFYEEMDGRINTDNLHHLMILGAPFLSGDDLQDQLKQQVALIVTMISFQLSFRFSLV